MKKTNYWMKLSLALIIVAGMILPAGAVFAGKDNHKPITQELIKLVEKNQTIRNMLGKSIAEAKKVNPDPKTNPVQSLSDYYNFIDRTSELIPQDVIENPSNLTRDQILQTICYFYFLVDQPLPESTTTPRGGGLKR